MRNCQSPLARRRVLASVLRLAAASLMVRASAASQVTSQDRRFMHEAVKMQQLAIERGDQPFGAVIVRGEEIVARGVSAVITDNDPTAHAEMQAIREACRRLDTRDLSGCVMYGTSRACPMCETAAYWANVSELRFGEEATSIGPPGYPRC